jgi:hypothetical protein
VIPSPVVREYWEPLGLLDFVLGRWTGAGRVEQIESDDSPEHLKFMERAWRAFEDARFPIRRLRTWVNVQIPREGPGYDPGYPHVHQRNDALTLVHYIDPGDVPAPLDILDGETVVETIYPEANLTVFIPNGIWHAVRKNNGTRNRVAMIATAYP